MPDWVSTMENQDGYPVNSYFLDTPEMVLGCPGVESTRYGYDYTVYPSPDADLSERLREAVSRIHGIYTPAVSGELEDEAADCIPADPDVKNFSYAILDGKIWYRENSVMARPKLNAAAMARVRSMVRLRDCVHGLIELQMRPDTPDSAIKEKQRELDLQYDAHVREYGLVNSRANKLVFDKDSSYYLLCSLEILDDDDNFQRKANVIKISSHVKSPMPVKRQGHYLL